jgi:hypothetical protein
MNLGKAFTISNAADGGTVAGLVYESMNRLLLIPLYGCGSRCPPADVDQTAAGRLSHVQQFLTEGGRLAVPAVVLTGGSVALPAWKVFRRRVTSYRRTAEKLMQDAAFLSCQAKFFSRAVRAVKRGGEPVHPSLAARNVGGQ